MKRTNSRRFYVLIMKLSLCMVIMFSQNIFLDVPQVFGADGSNVVRLTDVEKNWLKTHPIIRLAPDPKFQPIEFFDNEGDYAGMGADYVRLIEKKLGIRFEIVKCPNWEDVISRIKRREVDVLNAVVKTPQRETYLTFPPPYLIIPSVIIVRKTVDRELSLDMLRGMHVVMVSGYGYVDLIYNKYPQIEIELVSDLKAALRKVSFGMADAFVGDLATASSSIESEGGITNLKIAGETEPPNISGFAVRSDWPEFSRILEKGVALLTEKERKEIQRKWIHLESESGLTMREFRNVMMGATVAILLIIFCFLFWNRTLRRAVHLRTEDLQKEVEERKQAEEALRESEGKYRFIAENMSDVISVMDMNLQFSYVSPSIKRLTGFSVEEAIKYSIEEIMTPESFKKVLKAFEEEITLEASGTADFSRTRIIEFEQNKKDLSIVWVEASCSFIRDKERKPTGILVISRDITERKQTEQALKESESRFKALHNASFGGISIHDKGIILECNKGMSEITGFDYNELIGMKGLSLISDDTRDHVITNINAGYERPYEAIGVRKNGEEYPLRLEARNIPYKGEKVRVVEFRDITESKQAETEKKELEAQLQQAQKMESVGRLAGGVAHDYNNALAVIIGFTEMAINDVDPADPLRNNLKEVLAAANRAADITRQLLAFARKQTISPVVLDLNDNVESMLKMLRRLIGEDIDLTWSPGASLWPVKMDPSQIDQILANLCVNARDAIDGVGKISIETKNVNLDEDYCANNPGFVPGEFVLLAVSDNGCGMDKETLDNIFEPFFTTKDVDKGTGLGMSTVYGIAKQNNGFVNVYSEPGKGTTIRIYLPRHEGKTIGIRDEKTAEIPQGRGETILVVEDDLPILKLTEKILAGLDYAVLIANTTEAAMELAAEHAGEIDLLITDVIMPEMNGRDLAHQLKSLYPDLKRMFMSGYTADIIASRGILDKGERFIQKPFTKNELAIKVRRALDE